MEVRWLPGRCWHSRQRGKAAGASFFALRVHGSLAKVWPIPERIPDANVCEKKFFTN